MVIALSTASIEAYEGAVRSSKTITSILDFAKALRSPNPGEFAIVGRTERTAERNIVEPMVQMFGRKTRPVQPGHRPAHPVRGGPAT